VRWSRPTAPFTSRVAYAAAHVVPAGETLDWEHTLAFRHELWSWGFGVAEAMDTAQRGMGLDWATTQELIRRTGAEAAAVDGLLACGAGTDQLDPGSSYSLDQIADAYREQVLVVREANARVVLMASRALAATARSAADYAFVYDKVLAELDQPAILHWLGPMFDPELAGYWGSVEVSAATDTFLEVIGAHADVVDGVKVSLLDAAHEVGLRRRLPAGVRLYTGDDFNYPELIVGDGVHHSDALLGIFAAIYPSTSTALQALDAGHDEEARAILESTVELSRHVFSAPTWFYKTGIAFLAWLNGHQPLFTMLGGLETGRSREHLLRTASLAGEAGLLLDPDLAAARLASWESR
jgi:hypothetical protein